MTDFPLHPYLTHPRTGDPLRAIYRTKSGRLVWPVVGASPDDPANTDPAPEPEPEGDPKDNPEPDPDSKPLGDAGKQALKAERDARRAAEKELAKYRKADQDRADADKSEAEKRAAAEERATAAELRALRLEVAADKGLTPAQAKRLQGGTREELEADADELLTVFKPAKAAAPKPDPSQGSRGGGPTPRPTSLGQAVTAALKKA